MTPSELRALMAVNQEPAAAARFAALAVGVEWPPPKQSKISARSPGTSLPGPATAAGDMVPAPARRGHSEERATSLSAAGEAGDAAPPSADLASPAPIQHARANAMTSGGERAVPVAAARSPVKARAQLGLFGT